MSPRRRTVRLAGMLVAWAASTVMADPVPIASGGLDYQPAVLRSTDDGARIVVFERLDASAFGDLWLVRSTDGGATWTTPASVVASASNERHPALVQNGPGDYALFYLKGASANSSYRIWRATSSDGIAFTERGALDLGWSTGGEVNPHVVRHADGTLTMSYQRLPTGSYVAQSSDGGATWDTLKTQIASGSQLPRIAYRDGDGLYLASYQVGSSTLAMYVKTTQDVRDWSASPQSFATTGNNHDSLPVVMPDGAFALFWARVVGSQFDLMMRRSTDGQNWSPMQAITASSDATDVEPHPLVGDSPGVVELYWGRERPLGSNAYSIVREASVVVLDRVFDDGFDG